MHHLISIILFHNIPFYAWKWTVYLLFLYSNVRILGEILFTLKFRMYSLNVVPSTRWPCFTAAYYIKNFLNLTRNTCLPLFVLVPQFLFSLFSFFSFTRRRSLIKIFCPTFGFQRKHGNEERDGKMRVTTRSELVFSIFESGWRFTGIWLHHSQQ